MFRHLRIALLLYILVFVAIGQYLSDRRSTDWNDALWVGVWLVDPDGTPEVRDYLDGLGADAFGDVEAFFGQQASHYGLDLAQPFRVRPAGRIAEPLPAIPEDGSMLATVYWSLRMRWLVTRLHWSSDAPTPDITVFAVYRSDATGIGLDRSTALRKGMIALANLYADPSLRGSNQMIIAHELLHTLGATDKYAAATNLPVFPEGYAEPDRSPLHPQRAAELMAGRTPLAPHVAEIPQSLDDVVIGPATAREIGWLRAAD